jgi:hypothetical protein
MEIPPGNTMENSGKWNPERGFKSPRALSCCYSITYVETGMPIPADLIPLTALLISAREWARIISFNGNKRKDRHQPPLDEQQM